MSIGNNTNTTQVEAMMYYSIVLWMWCMCALRIWCMRIIIISN